VSKSLKVIIVIMGLIFFIFLGAAVTANSYLWLVVWIILSIGFIGLKTYLEKTQVNSHIIRFYPVLLILILVFGIQLSHEYVKDHPLSITTYRDVTLNKDRVKIEYGLYNGLTLTTIDRDIDSVDLIISSFGIELVEPLDIRLEFFVWIYVYLGIPVLLASVIEFLNFTVSKRSERSKRESVMSVIMRSGARFGARGGVTDHIQHQESFISESAKSDMIKDDIKHKK